MVYCSSCGEQCSDDFDYCPKCGKKLEDKVASDETKDEKPFDQADNSIEDNEWKAAY